MDKVKYEVQVNMDKALKPRELYDYGQERDEGQNYYRIKFVHTDNEDIVQYQMEYLLKKIQDNSGQEVHLIKELFLENNNINASQVLYLMTNLNDENNHITHLT